MVFEKGNRYGIVGIRMTIVFIACLYILPNADAQNPVVNNSGQYLTLKDCIEYALKHQPAVNQARINVSITKTNNAINLSGWLPQVNLSGSLVHYSQLPTTLTSDSAGYTGPPIPVHTGVVNTSVIPGVSVTEALFSPSLLYAARAAHDYVKQAELITDSSKINLVSSVTKSFYSLLLTLEQINVLKADTVELDRSVTDAYHQYVGGIVDETDYEEATITLNNTLVQLKKAIESVTPQYATLKQYMGFPPEEQFNVSFDTSEMIRGISLDTTQQLQYEKRIEYQQLIAAKKLQHEVINYYNLAFLPTVSAYYNYNYEFENNTFSGLYGNAYPYSLFGLTLNIPLFTGFSRLENVHKARLQAQIIDWNEVSLKSEIYTEYTTALANYKSNLYSFHVMSDNVRMAQRVYFVVELQYKQGIVAYLNVITAQSNLITSENGYINALFQTLSSKVDLEKAMGNIAY